MHNNSKQNKSLDITTAIVLNTNLKNMIHNKGQIQRVHLKICSKRLMIECDKSFKNQDLPSIPVAVNKNMKKWSNYVGIVDIASSGIYLGVEYGYNDANALFEIVQGLKYRLHDDMIDIIVKYTMAITMKQWILEPSEFMNIIDNHHIDMTKYNQMVKTKHKYNKWVTNIEVNDFEDDVKSIIHNYELDQIEEKKIRKCFTENDVNYKYLEDHTRSEFTQLLRSNPCNYTVGRSMIIYQQFSQYGEIVFTYN